MAFEKLTEKLTKAFRSLSKKGTLTESDIKEAMKEVRLALLEADVNFKIVKKFIDVVSEKAVGESILKSLTPAQQVIKIVKEELIKLVGETSDKLVVSSSLPSVYMLVGLQGAGKTTACAKLALHLKKKGKKPLLVACDVYRPAAIKQLQVLGKSIDIPVFEMGTDTKPEDIAISSINHAKHYFNDVVILDTAGRLHIDEDLMNELRRVQNAVTPTEILLTLDSMTGQLALQVAESFSNALDITGLILTKFDGDSRGGAALSMREVTGKSIKFISTGEKVSDLELFHPDRLVSRILGMGDVLSLIEKAQETFDQAEAQKLEEKLKKESFDLNDFLVQLQQIKKMGPLKDIIKMIPGIPPGVIEDANIDESRIVKIQAIIQSMTIKERKKPSILDASRRRRIAKGSGTQVSDVNMLMKQFEQMQKMFKQFNKKGMKGMFNKFGM